MCWAEQVGNPVRRKGRGRKHEPPRRAIRMQTGLICPKAGTSKGACAH